MKLSRAHRVVPSREASLRPTRARRSRDHFDTVSVRFKLLPQCVPVSPSPVWREASRDLWRSIGPSTMVVFTSVGTNSSTVSENIMYYFKFMLTAKRTLYFRRFRLDETGAPGVSDQRGRRKTAELHTSGAKRAATWQVGVKW